MKMISLKKQNDTRIEDLFSPSYQSGASGCSFWDIIPETSFNTTMATTGIRYNNPEMKAEILKSSEGQLYMFFNIPKKAFPLGVTQKTVDGKTILEANPEKMFCDYVYRKSLFYRPKDLKAFDAWLFLDLRIDNLAFLDLDQSKIMKYATQYGTKTMGMLYEYLKGGYYEKFGNPTACDFVKIQRSPLCPPFESNAGSD